MARQRGLLGLVLSTAWQPAATRRRDRRPRLARGSDRRAHSCGWSVNSLYACKTARADRHGETGPALLNAAQQDARTHVDHLGWLPIDATRFDLSAGLRGSAPRGVDPYEWATDAVIAEDYFAVIIANANATIAPNDALTTIASGGTTTQYTGKGAYSLYYNEARQFNTVDLWVQPNAARIIKMASINAAAALAQQLSSRLSRVGSAGTLNQTALASVMAQPFGYSTYNVRPLDAYAGIAATTVGQIYLLIYTYVRVRAC